MWHRNGDSLGGEQNGPAPPRPAWSLRCPALPHVAGRGGHFAPGHAKFGALRAPVRTLHGILCTDLPGEGGMASPQKNRRLGTLPVPIKGWGLLTFRGDSRASDNSSRILFAVWSNHRYPSRISVLSPSLFLPISHCSLYSSQSFFPPPPLLGNKYREYLR